MIRLIPTALAASFAAAGVFAATDVVWEDTSPGVVEIEVAAEELADCRQTLRDIGSQPIMSDAGTRIFFADTSNLPAVVCVAR